MGKATVESGNIPSWINEVEVLTVEEAEVLEACGAIVRHDYYHESMGWVVRPEMADICDNSMSVASHYSWDRGDEVRGFFFILKEQPDNEQQ